MRHALSRKIMAIAAVLTVVLLLPACLGTESFVQTVLLNGDLRGAYVIAPEDHCCAFTDAMRVGEEDGLRFYVDERTGSVGVYAPDAGTLWSALPTGSNRTAAVLTVEAFNGTATYLLNSQDHAAAYGAVEAERSEDAVRLTFTMSDQEKTALRRPDELSAGDVYVRVPLELTFTGGRLTASVDMAKVVCAPGLILRRISVLPDFGAIMESGEEYLPAAANAAAVASPAIAPQQTEPSTAAADAATTQPEPMTVPPQTSGRVNVSDTDFILIPDGCGAALYPALLTYRYPELELCVYGSDDTPERCANVGAFGVRRGSGACICVLTEGDALASVRTLREADAGTALYAVGPRYEVTPAAEIKGETAYGVTYEGRLSQTYSFLTGDSASFSGMVSAVRELLVHAGFLSAAPLQDAVFPVNVTVTGSLEGNSETRLTDLEQAESLLNQLRAKGIDKVNLCLDGFLTGGLEKASASAARLDAASGGKAALDSLCDYAEKQGYDVYLAKRLLTASGGPALRDLAGKRRTFTELNPFPSVGKEQYQRTLTGWSAIPGNASAFLNAAVDTKAAGVALTDLNAGLRADFSSRALDRATVSAGLSEIASSFSAVKKLWVNGADFNALRSADVITGVPVYPGETESEAFRSVPFLPMLLHGSYCYSGASAADGGTELLTLLRSVEYGCAPWFSWTGSSRSDACYEAHLPAAAAFCVRAAKELGDLTGLRMTDHYEIADGIYCTEYGSGIRVFVNYNNYSVAVGAVSVPPYDYLRID